MHLIYQLKPSRYHLTHVLSPDPRPHCWIPLVLIHCQSLGQNPHYQTLSLNHDLTRHWEKQVESRFRSLLSGFSPTAQTHCQTVQNLRASSFWVAGHCLNPHLTAVFGPSGDCQPHCQTCSGSHRNHYPKSLVSSAAHGPGHPRLSRCCCCCAEDVW